MPPSLRIECSEQRVLKGAVLLGLAQVVVHPVLLSASCPPRFDSSLRQPYADVSGGGANSAVVTGVNPVSCKKRNSLLVLILILWTC